MLLTLNSAPKKTPKLRSLETSGRMPAKRSPPRASLVLMERELASPTPRRFVAVARECRIRDIRGDKYEYWRLSAVKATNYLEIKSCLP